MWISANLYIQVVVVLWPRLKFGLQQTFAIDDIAALTASDVVDHQRRDCQVSASLTKLGLPTAVWIGESKGRMDSFVSEPACLCRSFTWSEHARLSYRTLRFLTASRSPASVPRQYEVKSSHTDEINWLVGCSWLGDFAWMTCCQRQTCA